MNRASAACACVRRLLDTHRCGVVLASHVDVGTFTEAVLDRREGDLCVLAPLYLTEQPIGGKLPALAALVRVLEVLESAMQPSLGESGSRARGSLQRFVQQAILAWGDRRQDLSAHLDTESYAHEVLKEERARLTLRTADAVLREVLDALAGAGRSRPVGLVLPVVIDGMPEELVGLHALLFQLASLHTGLIVPVVFADALPSAVIPRAYELVEVAP